MILRKLLWNNKDTRCYQTVGVHLTHITYLAGTMKLDVAASNQLLVLWTTAIASQPTHHRQQAHYYNIEACDRA